MAASPDGNFTKQNGDFNFVSENTENRQRVAYTWTVRQDLKFDSLEHCEGFDFCETKCLVNLGESDHILHHNP
jgi:hypothetical protein